MASIEKRTRNGRVTYRFRYRDPAGNQRSKVFVRKVDAGRWRLQRLPHLVQSFFRDPNLRYITA